MKHIIFVIGVSGCGKSTIGTRLSDATEIPFFDGDDFHPQSNIDKMTSGEALDDDDRKGWLISLNEHAIKHSKIDGAIIACSALKESYRDLLQNDIAKHVKWVFLEGSQKLIQSRLNARTDHFMPSNLLQSQFDTLEVPDYGLHLSIKNTTDILTKTIVKQFDL